MSYPTLGARMKAYEQVQDSYLTPRTPAILRLDGKAFHTWCRQNCKKAEPGKPYDKTFVELMNTTAAHLIDEVQGAQFAYVQSDEISILIHTYKNIRQEPWFGGRISKIESISAALASVKFSLEARLHVLSPGYFDARVRNYPEHEVNNYFIWRQQDQIRNSVFAHAQTFFSHKELQKKNRATMLDMMCARKGFDWNVECSRENQVGRVVTKEHITTFDFKDNRDFVESFLKRED